MMGVAWVSDDDPSRTTRKLFSNVCPIRGPFNRQIKAPHTRCEHHAPEERRRLQLSSSLRVLASPSRFNRQVRKRRSGVCMRLYGPGPYFVQTTRSIERGAFQSIDWGRDRPNWLLGDRHVGFWETRAFDTALLNRGYVVDTCSTNAFLYEHSRRQQKQAGTLNLVDLT